MRLTITALIFILTYAPMAQAGAWLRDKGEGFASTSVSTNSESELSTSVYLEYGLTDRRTIGADISYGVDRTGIQEGSGIIFLRFPLGLANETHKWAAHVGLGARYIAGYFAPAAEVGVSWGRGIKIGERYGWANIDTSYNQPQSPADVRIKVDGTFGISLTERTKVMAQMFNTFQDGDVFSKFAPSVLFSPGGGKTTLQLGAEIALAGGGEPTLKIAIWRAF
ncbi:MAG: hypothetical protein AB8B47_15595 [Roseobacter sp.]